MTPWNPYFLNRPCWTCGAKPSHYIGGEPFYPCTGTHEPSSVSDLFELRPVPLTVTLTEPEVARAYRFADEVLAADEEQGWGGRFAPRGETDREVKRRSFAAELAVSKWAGVEWRPKVYRSRRRAREQVDVDGRFEVRHSRRPNGELWIRPGNKPLPTILVLGAVPTLSLRGWIMPKDAMVERYWWSEGKASAWRVPQYDLRDPAELI